MYPITLIVSLIVFLVILETSLIYISEYGYVTEMRDYYRKETKQILIKDAAAEHLLYNMDTESVLRE